MSTTPGAGLAVVTSLRYRLRCERFVNHHDARICACESLHFVYIPPEYREPVPVQTAHTSTLMRTIDTGSQFVVFCLVGVLNTLVDISVYFLLTRAVFTLDISAAKALSYLAATVCSFVVNRYWTFGKRGVIRGDEIGRFYSTVALGIFINVGAQLLLVQAFGVNDIIGALGAALATALWGFAFSKWYVFKQ